MSHTDPDGTWDSPETEFSVIAICLLFPGAMAEVNLDPADFHRDAHRKIWTLMQDLQRAGQVPDPVGVWQLACARKVDIDPEYLGRCVDSGGWQRVNLEAHAAVVRDLATKRALRLTVHDSARRIRDTPGDQIGALIGEYDRQLMALMSSRASGSEIPTAREGAREAFALLEGAARTTGPRLSLGLPAVDQILGPLPRGKTVIIGGRPSMGKSALLAQVAVHNCRQGFRGLYCTMEDDRARLICRMLSQRSGVGLTRILTGQMDAEDYNGLMLAADDISQLALWIDATPALTVGQVRAKIAFLGRERPLDFVALDYLQLMAGRPGVNYRGDGEAKIGELATDLADMAKAFPETCILMASAMKRPEAQAKVKEPELTDLRGSGMIEFAAYQALLLHREGFYRPEARQDEALVKIAKNKDGPTGRAMVAWDGPCVRFCGV